MSSLTPHFSSSPARFDARSRDSAGRFSQRLALLLCLGSAGALTGCSLPSVGPDFRAPATATSSAFKDNESPAPTGAEARLAAEWWRDLGQPDLEELVARALKQNQGLSAAVARVEQARALAGQAQASQLPMLGATGLLAREQSSETTTNQFPSSLTTTYRSPLTLSWEIDFFGRVRRLSEGARANLKASEELAEFARLSVAAETASTYYALAATDQEERLLGETLGLQREILTLVEARRDAGRSSDLAVEQARTALAVSETELLGLKHRRSVLNNGLALLLGEAAPDFVLPARPQLTDALTAVPVGLPSELLRRRPDLAAAESGLRAANAQIGVAKAAFFPALSLTGSAGYASAELSSLFQGDSRAWSLGPSVYLPLFQGGRNRANYQRSKAAYEEATAGYRQAVLNAFREVQDALTASRRLSEQAEALRRAVSSARRAQDLATERHVEGATSYVEVLEARRVALVLERSSAALTGQRWIARVTLIRALGGAWEKPVAL